MATRYEVNSRLYLTIGPPGCGKTTTLAKKATEAAKLWGGKTVMICSLTKAAANEVRSRGVPIPANRVGTMHSHCFRALGNPVIAESKIAEWNEMVCSIHESRYVLSKKCENRQSKDKDIENPKVIVPTTNTPGDRLYEEMILRRTRMNTTAPRKELAPLVALWELWKSENDYIDFQGLIDQAMLDVDRAPGNPNVVYVDECQDMSISELMLLEKWSRYTNVVMVGDHDQAIFEWRGADPHAAANMGILESHKNLLEQSYRVPKAVRDYALAWIRNITNRDEVSYLPRDEPGEVRKPGHEAGLRYFNPVQLLRDAEQYTNQGKTVMFLASCGYMLDPLVTAMRRAGIPFHNTYAPTKGRWNPLGKRGGVTTSDRIEAFLRPDDGPLRWDWKTLHKWVAVIKSDTMLAKGSKTLVHDMAADKDTCGNIVDDAQLAALFKNSEDAGTALLAAWDGDTGWLFKSLLESHRDRMTYTFAVAQKYGPDALRKTPRITVGSVHSVKGGESDVVFIFPDMSPAGMVGQQYGGDAGRDAMIRMFYVGFTRAREVLVLCSPSGKNSIDWM